MKKAANDTLKNDALLKEIEQDVKNEQLKSLWDKYGLFIIIAVALILTAAVSFETFKTWRAKRAQELSNAYAVAVSLQNQGRFEESLNILQNLAKANRGIYGDVAKLQIANICFEQGKNAEAMAALEQLSSDEDANEQMRDIATIKLASYKLDSDASREEITDLLEPLTAEDSNWANIAHELLAMLAIREGDMEQAKAEYEKIVNSANVQDSLKARAQDMVTIISDQSK